MANGTARRVLFRGLALFFCLVWLTFCFGLIDVSAVAVPDDDGAEADPESVAVLSVAYGAVATFMAAPAFLLQMWAPRAWPASTQQVVLLALAFAGAGALGLDPLSFVSVATLVIMLAVLLAVHPLRRPALVPSTSAVGRPVLVVAVLGAGPWLVYAWQMAANSRAGLVPEEDALRPQAGGWAGAAVLAFAVVLLALLVSTGTPGWRLPLWTTVVTVLAFASMAVRAPSDPGSPGRAWGLLAAVWVLALLVSAERPSWFGRPRVHAPAQVGPAAQR